MKARLHIEILGKTTFAQLVEGEYFVITNSIPLASLRVKTSETSSLIIGQHSVDFTDPAWSVHRVKIGNLQISPKAK